LRVKFKGGGEGLSSVVALAILLSIVLALAIFVSGWGTSLIPVFTRFEEVKVQGAWQDIEDGKSTFMLVIFNSGNLDLRVERVFLNGRLVVDLSSNPVELKVGEKKVCVLFPPDAQVTRGKVYNIDLNTARGNYFRATVVARFTAPGSTPASFECYPIGTAGTY